MSYLDWIPAVSTSVLTALVLFLIQLLIATRVKESVKHEFEKKMEDIRLDNYKSKEEFKAELQAKEQQITLLREGALTALSNRQSELDKRRIEAVDQLWSAVSAFSGAKWVSKMMSVINYSVAAKKASQEEKYREFFEKFGGSFNPEILSTTDAARARPFVSHIAWALFTAYHTILAVAVMRHKTLELGVDVPNLLNEKSINDLIATALPHQAEYLERFGLGATHFLLEEIENKLLEELQRVVKGIHADMDSVQQAAEIMKNVDQVNKSILKSQEIRNDGEPEAPRC